MNSFNFIVSSTSTCGEKSVIIFHKIYLNKNITWYKYNNEILLAKDI
ncbi:hypothetical protein [Spiroplasma ixodetis]|nr:hypothetical protein [Spiroplasma ixodetis]